MEKKKMTVREWQEAYKAGKFDSKSIDAQIEAGWYDWFCSNKALAGRLAKLARLVMKINNPEILDNYWIWLKNNCRLVGGLYDDVRFEPFNEELRDSKYFVVTHNEPGETSPWCLYDSNMVFSEGRVRPSLSGNMKDIASFINKMTA